MIVLGLVLWRNLLSNRQEDVFGLVVWESLIVQLERKLLEVEKVSVMVVEQEFLVLSASRRTRHRGVSASDMNILAKPEGTALFVIRSNTNHCNSVWRGI
jgi:hypothetical protein